MNQFITLMVVWLVSLSGFIALAAGGASVSQPPEVDAAGVLARPRRTIGTGSSFVNCLAIGEPEQRFCSYDQALLEAIEQAATSSSGRRKCPEGRIFRHRCNVCECKTKEEGLVCSTDLCAEDFYDAKGRPKKW